MQLQKIRPDKCEKSVISYGSCQFPTLGFVVERWKERENFIPQPFWYIDVTVSRDGIKCVFNWKRQRLYDERACSAIMVKMNSLPIAKVNKLTNKRRIKYRPIALDTVQFERLASSKLRINAKRAMSIAEKLYTSGYISYPRTETNKFPPEINLINLIDAQKNNPSWGSFANKMLNRGDISPRNGMEY